MEHCRHFIKQWGEGVVVLSPCDIAQTRMEEFAHEITSLDGGRVLFDPQLYIPRLSNRGNYQTYSFRPSEYSTGIWSGSSLERLIKELLDLNDALSTENFILPGLLATQETYADWLSIQTEIAQSAHSIGLGERAWGTVALGGDACTTETQVAELLERAEVWGLGGYYLVCQPPKSEYLSNNPMWVANVLDVIAGLRMLGAKVILGYANHQMLIAALSKADAICSGTYQNVRVFTPERFRQKETETIRRRSTWYYCPHAMSEYQDSFLDIAFNLGVLADMKPDVEMAGYANRLFSGLQPTTVGFDESASFRHYLNSLRQQCRSSVKPTFESTKQEYLTRLDRAGDLLNNLRSVGVSGQQRDFRDIVDVQRAAVHSHSARRGPLLSRRWARL